MTKGVIEDGPNQERRQEVLAVEKPPVDSCAFLPCDQVERCSLDGGCVVKRFPGQQRTAKDVLKAGAPALNGTKASRSRPATKK